MKVNHNVVLKQQSPLVSDIEEFENTKSLCLALLKTKHYQTIGEAGVFAIVETCKSLRIDPRIGLNKGMYYVRGAVEMSARLMNALIRGKKHSITKDKKSDDAICILHGKRSDNGDTWSVSYSIKDAERAGLLKNPTWKTTPSDMLFARALSRLARQLFPDVIGNCYVEGEISESPPLYDNVEDSPVEEAKIVDVPLALDPVKSLDPQEVEEIEELIGDDEERLKSVLYFIEEKFKVTKFDHLDPVDKDWLCERLRKSNERELQGVS
jgi:hypothetical protein